MPLGRIHKRQDLPCLCRFFYSLLRSRLQRIHITGSRQVRILAERIPANHPARREIPQPDKITPAQVQKLSAPELPVAPAAGSVKNNADGALKAVLGHHRGGMCLVMLNRDARNPVFSGDLHGKAPGMIPRMKITGDCLRPYLKKALHILLLPAEALLHLIRGKIPQVLRQNHAVTLPESKRRLEIAACRQNGRKPLHRGVTVNSFLPAVFSKEDRQWNIPPAPADQLHMPPAYRCHRIVQGPQDFPPVQIIPVQCFSFAPLHRQKIPQMDRNRPAARIGTRHNHRTCLLRQKRLHADRREKRAEVPAACADTGCHLPL